ncbi:hypothetical protein JI667_21580, partial [Bacillus sp. NTK074B]|nr:hypothetical protein [Bacillus sp. NTK074B]
KEVVLAVALMAVAQMLNNAVAGTAMRSASLAWLGLAPLFVALTTALALIAWGSRTRRVRGARGDIGAPRSERAGS